MAVTIATIKIVTMRQTVRLAWMVDVRCVIGEIAITKYEKDHVENLKGVAQLVECVVLNHVAVGSSLIILDNPGYDKKFDVSFLILQPRL